MTMKWFRYEVKVDMKWMVWSDLGMKWFRYELTLVWSALVTLVWSATWYEVIDGMKWLMVWNDSWYETTLSMKWFRYELTLVWSALVTLVWSDTKNEVNMVWSVWVQKIEKVVETFKANEQVVLNAENRKLIRQSGFKIWCHRSKSCNHLRVKWLWSDFGMK